MPIDINISLTTGFTPPGRGCQTLKQPEGLNSLPEWKGAACRGANGPVGSFNFCAPNQVIE